MELINDKQNMKIKEPNNEPVLTYAPGSRERELLKKELDKIGSEQIEVPVIIAGKNYYTGDTGKIIMPHDHQHSLGTWHKASEHLIELAIESALKAKKEWENVPTYEREAIFVRAATLLQDKYRWILNAATMLNQGKSVHQAEIDAACETIDYLNFNPYYMNIIFNEQPISTTGTLNRMEYRPLEGFVFAVSPFNFTSIAANLATAPALMGNVVIWKPASTAVLSGYYLMQLYKEAGFPDGVINFLPGSAAKIADPILSNHHLAGVHFTGSTGVFQDIWKKVGCNIERYRNYPRIVGETGGKNFIFVHSSASLPEVATAIVRGGFEYQGQKCSAASRVYIPTSMWNPLKEIIGDIIHQIKVGDPRDFSNFMNAVIDEASFDKIIDYIKKAESDMDTEIVFGGDGDKTKGYFIQPTVFLTQNPKSIFMEEEIFGPVVTVYLYHENKYEETLELCDQTSPYALTGSIFAKDEKALATARWKLRYSAGNFYINDKPTGAVVGQQPFGGSRSSGTNDKAGSHINLHRWIIPRTIKENFQPPKEFNYPYMMPDKP